MDKVFAPWRIEWVEREETNPDVDCVFCAFQEGDDELPDGWNELQSVAAERGINPQGHSEPELRARLRYAKDASDLDPHPRASPCRSCHRLTLSEELDWTERRCPECRGEQEAIDPEKAVEATGG